MSQNPVFAEPGRADDTAIQIPGVGRIFGRVFMVRNSVPVRMTLFSNLGSTKGFISFSVPKRAEPYSSSRRYFWAFLLLYRSAGGTPPRPQCQRASQREQAPAQSRQKAGPMVWPSPMSL